MTKRILILTAGYGEGHNAAAKALAAAMSESGQEVRVRDLFAEAYGRRQEFSRQLYMRCIEHTPLVWALVYQALDYLPLMRRVIAPLLGAMQKQLSELLREWHPHSVVSVFPGYNYLLDRLYPKGVAPFDRHTLVTDSLTINSIWTRAASDSWMVPNEDTAEVLRNAGVAQDRIHVTGFPVPLIFADERPARKPPGRGEPLRVLYMINNNRKHAPEIVRRLLEMRSVALTVTAGRDPAFREELSAIAQDVGRPMELHGWTDQIPQLLMRNHLLIGKAGGAATQEAIAAETPLLVTKIVPGQELGNARLIEKHGCGAIARTPEAVIQQVQALLRAEGALWRQWHECVQRIARPEAARDAARFVLNFRAEPVHA